METDLDRLRRLEKQVKELKCDVKRLQAENDLLIDIIQDGAVMEHVAEKYSCN